MNRVNAIVRVWILGFFVQSCAEQAPENSLEPKATTLGRSPSFTAQATNCPTPTISVQPASVSAEYASFANFSVQADGQGYALTYQWRRNGNAIALRPDGTDPDGVRRPGVQQYVHPNFLGTYSVLVSSACGSSIVSQNATLSMHYRQGDLNQNGLVNSEDLGILLAAWGAHGGVGDINGDGLVNSSDLPFLLANWGGSNVAPFFISTLQSQTAAPGDVVNFQVQAYGPDLHFGWYHNGQSMQRSTDATFTTVVEDSSDGGTYVVQVSNGFGSIQSSANLLVIDPNSLPVITTQPQPITRRIGESASLFVVADYNSGPLTYQWKKSGVAVAGATSASLNFPSVQSQNSGVYTVAIRTPGGAILESDPASLYVVKESESPSIAPAIIRAPRAQSVTAGTDVIFNVLASGSRPMTYEWFKNGSLISSSEENFLVIKKEDVNSAAAGSYYVRVANGRGSVTSAAATLTVINPNSSTSLPIITQHPVTSYLQTRDTRFQLSVAATGATTYQWRKNGIDIPNATTSTLQLTGGNDGYQLWEFDSYTVAVSNARGTVISHPATVDVFDRRVEYAQQPSDLIISQGTNGSLQATVSKYFNSTTSYTPVGTFNFSWKKTRDGNGNSINPPQTLGTNSPILSFTNISASQAGSYQLMTQYTLPGSAYTYSLPSREAIVGVVGAIASPKIVRITDALNVSHGGMLSFRVDASGTPPLYYQWYKDNQPIAGAISDQLTIPGAKIDSDGGYYYVQVSNSVGTVNSATITPFFSSETPVINRIPQRTSLPLSGDPFVDYSFGTPIPGFELPVRPFVDEETNTGPVTISYSFSSLHSKQAMGKLRFFPMNERAKGTIRKALRRWSEVSRVEFQEVDERYGVNGTLRFYAFGNLPYGGASTGDSDIQFGFQPVETDGSYDLWATIHELGHSLNSFVDVTTAHRPAQYDNHLFTIMSYNWGGEGWSPRTPMLIDIPAAQYAYGASTYTPPMNRIRFEPNDNIFGAIFSSSDQLILDLSNRTDSVSIDIFPDQWSRIGQSAGWVYQNKNLSFATGYGGSPGSRQLKTLVKEVVTGSGNDSIQGNSADNILRGNSGDDVYIFDFTRGRIGNDRIVEGSNEGTDSIRIIGLAPDVITASIQGSDLLLSFGAQGSVKISNYQLIDTIERIEFDNGVSFDPHSRW